MNPEPTASQPDYKASVDAVLDASFPSRLRVLAGLLEACGSNSEEIQKKIDGLPPESAEALKMVMEKSRELSDLLPEALAAGTLAVQKNHSTATASIPKPEELENFPRQTRQPFPVRSEDILLVTKLSKIQYDMQRWNLSSPEEVIQRYKEGEEDIKRIMSSHLRQLECLERLKQVFPAHQIIGRDEISIDLLKKAAVVVSIGGDNHFQWVADHIRGDIPVIGVNSDPERSNGTLLSFSDHEFLSFLPDLLKGNYIFKAWTRLDVDLDGVKLTPVTGELFVGQQMRELMSRHSLKLHETQIEQKSSGLLITTGAGSTGWYNNAIRSIFPDGLSFAPEEVYARFALTEIAASTKNEFPPLSEGVLLPGEELEITSLNREGGIVSSDSLFKEPFERGSILKVKIADDPLWVISSGVVTP